MRSRFLTPFRPILSAVGEFLGIGATRPSNWRRHFAEFFADLPVLGCAQTTLSLKIRLGGNQSSFAKTQFLFHLLRTGEN